MLENQSIDLILVLTPPAFHCEHAILALKSGKHVLVEKPMALTSQDCKMMIDASQKSGKILTVNHNHRFSGFFQYNTLHKLLSDGIIGKPYLYSAKVMSSWGGYKGSPDYIQNWECKKEYGGGTILSWGPHLVDLILNMHNSKPVSVYSVMNTKRWEFSGDSYSNTIIKFEDGAAGQIEICYVSSQDHKLLSVQGEKGMIKYEGEAMRHEGKTTVILDGKEQNVDIIKPLEYCFYNNLFDVITNVKKILIDPLDIMSAITVIEAAMVSAEKNEVVLLSEF
jgi:predicted dehydrogenase